MTIQKLVVVLSASVLALPLAAVPLSSQNQVLLDPASIKKPLADSWPTYSGDYSGRRYSSLTQVNQNTVKNLTLAWVARLTAGDPAAGGGGGGRGFGGPGGFGGGGGGNVIVGGEGTGEFGGGANANVKGAILMVKDVLYVTAPDNVWALDARDGRELWRYYWKTKGGTHIGNRGAAIWNDYLYFETPDNYLVSLDARTGKERWHVEIADFDQQYFSTMAPIVVDNHVLVGTGNDLDAPGFLQSYDPETGKRNWIFYTVPMKPGDPGLDTWPNLESARHGGGQVWIPGSSARATRRQATRASAARETTCSPAR
jgi:alcohol dehydrogenase (cytochrome c)